MYNDWKRLFEGINGWMFNSDRGISLKVEKNKILFKEIFYHLRKEEQSDSGFIYKIDAMELEKKSRRRLLKNMGWTINIG